MESDNMRKELPKMYQGKPKNFSNIQKVFSTLDRKDSTEVIEPANDYYTIEQKIYNIFKSPTYIYKIDVVIITDNDKLEKRLVGKNKDNLITIDNEYIPIKTIKDIYLK